MEHLENDHRNRPGGPKPAAPLDAVLDGVPPEEAAALRALWDLAGTLPEPDLDLPEADARVWQHLNAHLQDPPRRTGLRAVWTRRVPALALAATLLIGAIGVALWLQPVTQHAPPGQRLRVALPDGSSVELNSGATVRYARHFDTERVVHLEGEAFFTVQSLATDAGEARPFRVETFNAQVRVLGTRFNVKAWPHGTAPATVVALVSGRVTLAPRTAPAQAVEVKPGAARRIDAGTERVSRPDTTLLRAAVAWRAGHFLYQDEPLGGVLEDLSRRFGVTIALHPSVGTAADVRHRRIHYALRRPASVETVLQDVCTPLGLNYRATAQGYELYSQRPN